MKILISNLINKYFFQTLVGITFTAIVLAVGIVIFSSEQLGYLENIYATGAGTLLTISVLDILSRRRSENARKQELIFQMGSPDNGFAVEATRWLRQKGWLKNGSLIRAQLFEANLQKANLFEANLQKAILSRANLQEARLNIANLQEADLMEANLYGAECFAANLQGANLYKVNLQGAFLVGANLNGANLSCAQLQGIHADTNTILPDGTNWTAARDLREFTHYEDWQFEQIT